LDISSAYLSFDIAEADRCKTAVMVPEIGLLEYEKLVFGLTNAPSFFSPQMRQMLDRGPDGPTGAKHYLDDVLGGGKDFPSALLMLRKTFDRVRDSGMLLKAKKCYLFKAELQYLGHVLTRSGVKMDPSKVEKIVNWPVPHNVGELRSFLGLATYYMRFQAEFAKKAAPLYSLTRINTPYEWTPSHQAAFDTLKHGLATAPVLALPEIPGEPMILTTDASLHASGAILSQPQNGIERVIAYVREAFSFVRVELVVEMATNSPGVGPNPEPLKPDGK
jgi:hypothetical protein